MRERKKIKQWQRRILFELTQEERKKFFSLSKRDQRKLLKNAEKVSANEKLMEKQKQLQKAKMFGNFPNKLPTAVNIGTGVVKNVGVSTGQALKYMFQEWGNPKDQENSSEQQMPTLSSGSQSLIDKGRRLVNSNPMSQGGRNQQKRKNVISGVVKNFIEKGSKKATKKGFSNAMKTIIKAPIPISAKLIILLILLLLVVVVLIVILYAFLSVVFVNSEGKRIANVSEKTESYRPLVVQYCNKYEIDDYVELTLALIEQESSGNPPDVMQSEESPYNKKPPIDTPEESIDCGCHQLADCITSAGCTGPNDIANISLALQSYNFGNGYMDWAKKNYGGYSSENAVLFSKIMCEKLGWKNYGDVEYVPHVLRYYIETSNMIENKKASEIVKELKENNVAEEKVWSIIERGATLVGKVTYSQTNRQVDGRDNPTYMDCSSFVAWCMNKAGIDIIPYSSYTGTFLSSNKLSEINASELQPGDLGLKNRSTAGGSSNHIGIYCGKLKNGTKVWLHCTSSSSTSLTGNDTGVMFGAYTNFTVFKRIKKG